MIDFSILPEAFLALSGLLLVVAAAVGGPKATPWVTGIAVAAFLVTGGFTYHTRPVMFDDAYDGLRHLAFNGMFIVDGFARYVKLLILAASALAAFMALPYLKKHDMARPEYPVLIVFATVGMMLMVSANNLLTLYVGLELQSLALYVLAAFQRDQARSSEAGLKYFVLGALSSGVLLYGISLIYGFTGSVGFEEVRTVLESQSDAPAIGTIFGLVFICAGLAFKISAVPFHMWTPDVYEGAPTPVTAFFAAAPKLAAMALLIRVLMQPFGGMEAQWHQIITFASVASMLVGAFAAVVQTNIKRLMAYSSIGHVGYALLGLAAGTEAGVQGMLIYLAIYFLNSLGAFAVILGLRAQGEMVEKIEDLAGLSKTRPMLALGMVIFMFSMAGIPPLAGFFGKFYVFTAAIESGLYPLAIIGVLTSAVACYYYLRIIKIMYFDEPKLSIDATPEFSLRSVLTVSSLAMVLFCLAPAPIIESARLAASGLLLP